MKIKFSFRLLVTLISVISAILLGLVRIADPQCVEVMRLKYFDKIKKKYPRQTEGQTYSVIVDIDEKSLREIGQWPWPRTVLADLFEKSKEAGMLVLGLDVLFAEKDRTSPELIAKDLKKKNIFFAGIDLIDQKLNGDINVTSPTGLKTLYDLSGINLAKIFWKELKA